MFAGTPLPSNDDAQPSWASARATNASAGSGSPYESTGPTTTTRLQLRVVLPVPVSASQRARKSSATRRSQWASQRGGAGIEITSTEYEPRVTRCALVAGLDGPLAGSPTSTLGVAPRAQRHEGAAGRAVPVRPGTSPVCGCLANPILGDHDPRGPLSRGRRTASDMIAEAAKARRVRRASHSGGSTLGVAIRGTSRKIASNDARCTK
jgi:hypothetical protein